MQQLYPEIKPNHYSHIAVGDGHYLYVEESGTAEGIPLVYLHGGPGAGCTPTHRRYSDPEKYRTILIDQRGCGRSTPHASLENNTLTALINDLEVVREKLGIERWVIMGGSWGTTLALAYAQCHPEKVLGLILRGVFLGRKQDLDWLYGDGTRKIFPEHWQEFILPIPEEERDELIGAFYQRLTGDDEIARMAAAKAWSIWEGKVATLEPNQEVVDQLAAPHIALSMARISAHYFVNQCFLSENQLLENAYKLEGIPGIIVHGRYDMVCPIENAWSLQNAWPQSVLHIIRDAGHAASEAGIVDGLVRATKEMFQELSHDCSDPTGN